MSPVLFVADLFHPLDILAVHRFLNGDMRHRGRGRRPVPVLLPGRRPDHITGPEFIDRSALALNPATAGCDNQSLAERMRVPGGAGTRLECDAALHQSAPAYAWRVVRLEIRKRHTRAQGARRRPARLQRHFPDAQCGARRLRLGVCAGERGAAASRQASSHAGARGLVAPRIRATTSTIQADASPRPPLPCWSTRCAIGLSEQYTSRERPAPLQHSGQC
jgi:hypothetical protein